MNDPVVGGLLLAIAVLVLRSCLLCAAAWLVTSWTRVVTASLPPAVRERRRLEIASELHEQRAADRSDGFTPAEIGIRIIGRWLRGIPADLAWGVQEWRRARLLHTSTDQMLAWAVPRVASLEADPFTKGHSRRVAQLAYRTARALGIRKSDAQRLRLAALVHEIGMCELPQATLRKPSPLSDEEVAALRNHPHLGANSISRWPHLQDVAEIVLSSHERFDGTGYPRRLSAYQIPLAARILFVADAFDVMTTSKPYRVALTCDEAVKLLRQYAGHMFDPQVVQAVAQLHPHEA